MELREETIQKLQTILEELEVNISDSPESAPAILASLQEIEEIMQDLSEKVAKDSPGQQRISFLSKMLDMAKEEIAAGGVQDGLWFGKSVITFLLNGTSAGAVPVETEEYE